MSKATPRAALHSSAFVSGGEWRKLNPNARRENDQAKTAFGSVIAGTEWLTHF